MAKDIRLTPEEQQWLGGLLASRQVPATTMSLEMLDGFFTALVIGPETLWLLTHGETRKTKRVRLFTEFVSHRLAVYAPLLAGLSVSRD